MKSGTAECTELTARAGSGCTLVGIKLAHTVIWALLAGSIVVLPVLAWAGWLRLAAILSVVIWVDCGVLLLNHWRCPLTDLAARYTEDRSPDFDIYMPVWLARHNKTIFGTLFLVNELVVMMARWRGR